MLPASRLKAARLVRNRVVFQEHLSSPYKVKKFYFKGSNETGDETNVLINTELWRG